MGSGHLSCGRWLKAENSNELAEQARSATMGQWVTGYLSGVAVNLPPVGDGLRRSVWEGIRHWIDNYCQAHPLESVNDAAAALAVDLASKNIN
jgi:hypothetical protein